LLSNTVPRLLAVFDCESVETDGHFAVHLIISLGTGLAFFVFWIVGGNWSLGRKSAKTQQLMDEQMDELKRDRSTA